MTIKHDKPSITQVLGDHGEVANGRTIEGRSFVVVGTARSNAMLNIYDGRDRTDFAQSEEPVSGLRSCKTPARVASRTDGPDL